MGADGINEIENQVNPFLSNILPTVWVKKGLLYLFDCSEQSVVRAL